MTDKSEMSSVAVAALNLPRDPNEAAAENLIRIAPTIARMRKKLYDEYVAAGFSPEQAERLCVK